MRNSPIRLAAIIAALLLSFCWETPARASSVYRQRPQPLAPHGQPPDSDNASSSGGSGSKGSLSGGGRRSGGSVATTANGVSSDVTLDDIAREKRDIRAQSRLDGSNSPADRDTSAFSPAPVPTLEEFAQMVRSSESRALTGVYVKDTFALRVLRADSNDLLNVTIRPGAVTNSCGISHCPGVGLLAHNLLSGAQFFRLSPGQEVELIYGDGSTGRYRVVQIRQFQALSPNDPYSSFVDLDTRGAPLSSTDVFWQTFGVPDRVVFQTCITANGVLTWGRLFVIAEPMWEQSP